MEKELPVLCFKPTRSTCIFVEDRELIIQQGDGECDSFDRVSLPFDHLNEIISYLDCLNKSIKEDQL